MTTASAIWKPAFSITPSTARALMRMEAVRAQVAQLPIPPSVDAELRRQARLRSTHFSTRIEGNRLTLEEAEQIILGAGTVFQGRERDASEVRNYWHARLRVEEWAEAGRPLSEELIRRLHALVERGPRARPTPWRDGQNAIRDAGSGALVYLPPEARDVPDLMSGLLHWIASAERGHLPVPIIAGLAHYQFVTIHPYCDGNGRSARLLATLLLHRGGYGLHGFLSVEETYARDLAGYYGALATHPHHNDYMGRAEADLSAWAEYFCETLAQTFEAVGAEARRLATAGLPAEPALLRRLDRRARAVLALFATQERITTAEVARVLGLSERMARVQLQQWTAAGWLEMAEVSRKKRSYELTAAYRHYMDQITAMA